MSILLVVLIYFAIPVSLSISGILIVRKFTKLSTLESHNEVAGFIYAVIGVLYALLLAFVVVDVWEQYRESDNYTSLEAASLVSVCRDVDVFTEPSRSEIQGYIYKYAKQMIELEFPAMMNNTTNDKVKNTYEEIWKSIYKYKPENSYAEIWYQETIKEMNEFDHNRKMRIYSVSLEIHSFMWVVLILGAVLTVLFSYLFGTRNAWSHITMVFCLSSMICLIFLLLVEFDHPFAGVIHVMPDSFERSLESITLFINN